MKYLVVLVVVLGFACGSEEETLGYQDIDVEDVEDFELDGRQTTVPAAVDPMLLIGNIFGFLNDVNLTDPNSAIQQIINSIIPGAATAVAPGLGLAGLGGIKTVFDLIVGGILGLISVPVGIANMILSLVGLVVLIIFLIDGGDFGSLLGVARSMPASWIPNLNAIIPDVDLVNNPIVEEISNRVFQAIEEWDL